MVHFCDKFNAIEVIGINCLWSEFDVVCVAITVIRATISVVRVIHIIIVTIAVAATFVTATVITATVITATAVTIATFFRIWRIWRFNLISVVNSSFVIDIRRFLYPSRNDS